MYEHVKTGCKRIPPSEQPLQFQSGYYMNKPRSSALSLTSVLDGCDSQNHALAASCPGRDSVPVVQEAGWSPGPVWTGAENLASIGIRHRLRYPGPLIVLKLG